MTIFGDDYPTPDGTCIRDYIHVEDLAAAHLLALEATDPADPRTGPATGPCEPLICNLGSGTGFSNRQIVAAAEQRRRPAHRREDRPAPAGRSADPGRERRAGRRDAGLASRGTARSRRSSARPGSGAGPIRAATRPDSD